MPTSMTVMMMIRGVCVRAELLRLRELCATERVSCVGVVAVVK